MSLAHSASILLCLALTWTAYGQLGTTKKESSRGNITVQSVQVIPPVPGEDYYEFTFRLSSGEVIMRDGILREVHGKVEVVMNGYVTEVINGKPYRIRYAADKAGKNTFVASREEAGQLNRNFIPDFIRPLNTQNVALSFRSINRHTAQNSSQTTNSQGSSITRNMNNNNSEEQLSCTLFSDVCIPKMDQIFENLTRNYDKQIRPGVNDAPTQVWADFHIRGLLGIDEVDMEFELSIALTVDWIDERLRVDKTGYPSNFIFPKRTLMDAAEVEKIWTPRVTVLNEKESVEYSDIFDRGSLVWDPNRGRLILTRYGILTLTCDMSLQNFPIDAQICSAMVGSNFYSNDEIDLAGNLALDPIFSNLVKTMELIHYGEHRIVTAVAGSRTTHRTILVCDLLLKRHVGYYLIGTYFPAALIVIISWLSFWMPREDTTERVCMGVTCVLTVTTLLISSQSSSPKVSDVKAIDIYIGVCFGLIFATLAQSTLIGYVIDKVTVSNGSQTKFQTTVGSKEGSEYNPELALEFKHAMAGGVKTLNQVNVLKLARLSDNWSRVVFPLLFVAFNVVYWAYYGVIWHQFDDRMYWKDPTPSEIPIDVGSWFGDGGN